MIVGGSMEMLSGWIEDIEASFNPTIIHFARVGTGILVRPGQLPVIQVIMQKFWFISVVD